MVATTRTTMKIAMFALQNVIWIATLSNLQGQSLEFFRGMIDPLIEGSPFLHMIVNVCIGTVMPAETAPSIALSERSIRYGLNGWLGYEWSNYIATSVSGAAAAIFSLNGVGKRFQPGLLLDLSNMINTTTGYYFGRSLIPFGKMIFWMMQYLVMNHPYVAIGVVATYVLYCMYCNLYIIIKIMKLMVNIVWGSVQYVSNLPQEKAQKNQCNV